MKKIVLCLLLASLTGCESQTRYGQCVGVLDDKDPTKVYKASVLNIVLGIIFVETVVVPAVVLLTELQCPVGSK